MTEIVRSTSQRVWVVLTFGEERQHAGNSGYEDSPDAFYSYDSYVANFRQIAAGDAFILCDRKSALGIARIETIDEYESTRSLQRCPTCNVTGIKKRLGLLPLYRCKRGHTFDMPLSENVNCRKFTAHFGKTFHRFSDSFDRKFLRQGCPCYSDQLAMQEFSFSRMKSLFEATFPSSAKLIDQVLQDAYLFPEAVFRGGLEQGYSPSDEDSRKKIFRQISERRGQQGFRDCLRIRFGDRCAISGCDLLHVLEAAHIRPYRGENDNHPDNGLLLRADLHTLFDLDLIGIDPSTLAVCIHTDLSLSDYRLLEGSRLNCPADACPSR